jgi:predicted DNA-binding transcriptional regulator YafY
VSNYSELIKNFERIRAYMREFYVFGFKSREDYAMKSARTYDDERRRMESWLGEHVSYVRTPEGKNVYISIDSRVSGNNPLYKAWKAKSFTDTDIALHFIIFDILNHPSIELSLPEMLRIIDGEYSFADFDESTLRKKLKEYCELGLLNTRKDGKVRLYARSEDRVRGLSPDMLNFFSEVAPCGVIGSFLLDRREKHDTPFDFKHHYITGALDSEVLASLFDAMREKRAVTVENMNKRRNEPRRMRIIPLRVFISVQNGRQHLVAYSPEVKNVVAFRLDYLSGVRLEEPVESFDELRAMLDGMERLMWGVNIKRNKLGEDHVEHVEMDVRVGEGEEYLVQRLEREKRCGRVVKIDSATYRFIADVYDTSEMMPWIRTFISHIVGINLSNKIVERQFRDDLSAMYRSYGIDGGDTDAV